MSMHSKKLIVSVYSLLAFTNYKVINNFVSEKEWYLEVIEIAFNGRNIPS